MLAPRRPKADDHPPFNTLPVRMVTLSRGSEAIAVHVSGRLDGRVVPIVCLAGYQRNMTDHGDLVRLLSQMEGPDRPVVLIDLPGRGRSRNRARPQDYASPNDARDVADVVTALGIERAAWLGQGYGGQVVMGLSALRPLVVAAACLVDAGPVSDTRGIVRLRNNLRHIESLRGARQVQASYKRMLASDYPGASDIELERLMNRVHAFDRGGRARPLYDRRLAKALDQFSLDDVLMAQWSLFDALAHAPLLLVRTQLTDQMRRQTFDEMIRRRPDAEAVTLEGQGSPALFDRREHVAMLLRLAARVR